MLRYPGRLCVPDVDNLRERILEEAHGSRYSIHPWSTKMYHDVREIYLLEGLKKGIAEFVAKCKKCLQVKDENLKSSGLLQEIKIPTWKWEDIKIDFVVGLPRTQKSQDSMWVVVDRLTNCARFISVKSSYSAEDYERIFLNEILCRYNIS